MSEPMHSMTVPKPVDVIISTVADTRSVSPDYGVWTSYILLGTEPAQQILPFDPCRAKATIWVLPGFDDNNVNGNVYMGTREQVQASQGGIFPAGVVFEMNAQSEVWVQGDGSHHLVITVLAERYRK